MEKIHRNQPLGKTCIFNISAFRDAFDAEMMTNKMYSVHTNVCPDTNLESIQEIEIFTGLAAIYARLTHTPPNPNDTASNRR